VLRKVSIFYTICSKIIWTFEVLSDGSTDRSRIIKVDVHNVILVLHLFAYDQNFFLNGTFFILWTINYVIAYDTLKSL
jgi:hypothetical protein